MEGLHRGGSTSYLGLERRHESEILLIGQDNIPTPCQMGRHPRSLQLQHRLSQGCQQWQTRCSVPATDCIPPPLPSLPILPYTGSLPPLFHTPPVIGTAVLVSPDDPLLPAIAAAQAADEVLSVIITVFKGPGGESNPALPVGNPSGRSRGQYTFQNGLLYSQGRICIPTIVRIHSLALVPLTSVPNLSELTIVTYVYSLVSPTPTLLSFSVFAFFCDLVTPFCT